MRQHATEGWAPILQTTPPPEHRAAAVFLCCGGGACYKALVPNQLARAMRRRMTDAEMRLWFHLRPMRRRGLAFRRQSPVGRYIFDFECRRAKLGIELDGSQHARAEAQCYDAERSEWLAAKGYVVMRFWNHDVLRNTDAVVDHIVRVAAERILPQRDG